MTPSFDWEDDEFPKGADVFVGHDRRPAIVHSRSITANGTKVYGIRYKSNDGTQRVYRRQHEDVDGYCEAHQMEGLMI